MKLWDKRDLGQSTINVWAWLNTWLDETGGLHGYVVHHHRDCFRVLAPDTWTQSPAILGLISLYEKTLNRKWLDLAQRLSDFLINNYLEDLHVFYNSNHEKKPLGHPHLIGNALASYALLKFAHVSQKNGSEWQKYYEVAKDNVLNFVLPLWDKEVQAFYGWPHRKVHIHNMNSTAIMALTALSEIENRNDYIEEYAIPAARYSMKCQIQKGGLQGAFPYADRLRDFITLYTLITSLGLYKLYEHTEIEKLLTSTTSALSHLSKLLDSETSLLRHYWGMKYPQWIPDTFLFVWMARCLEKRGVTIPANTDKMLESLLEKQYENGAFPLSIGFTWRTPRGPQPFPERATLRDALPTPNWNSWIFWILSELVSSSLLPKEPDIKFPWTILTYYDRYGDMYRIEENTDEVKIFRVNGTDQCGDLVVLVNKKDDICRFSLLEERDFHWMTLRKIERLPRVVRKAVTSILRDDWLRRED
jgi:hypothetical protein